MTGDWTGLRAYRRHEMMRAGPILAVDAAAYTLTVEAADGSSQQWKGNPSLFILRQPSVGDFFVVYPGEAWTVWPRARFLAEVAEDHPVVISAQLSAEELAEFRAHWNAAGACHPIIFQLPEQGA